MALSLLAWAIAAAMIFPILWTLLVGLKAGGAVVEGPLTVLTADWSLSAYADVLYRSAFGLTYRNSVAIAVGATTLGMALAIPAAWAMAAAPPRRAVPVLTMMALVRMLPPVGMLIPVYVLARRLGLEDTRIILITLLMLTNLPVLTAMLYSQFSAIPAGVSGVRLAWGAPAWAATRAIAATSGLGLIIAWNESFWTLTLTAANAAPLTQFIANYADAAGVYPARFGAAVMMAIAPPLLLGWAIQRHLARGLTFGVVK